MRRRRGGIPLLFLFLVGIAAASGTARADQVDTLLDQADPEVRAAIDGRAGDVRVALSGLLTRGNIDREHLVQALGKALFAPQAVDTLIALAGVDHLPGAGETFERMLKANEESGVRGSTFEIQVAAALGDRVAALGPIVDGDEVDLLLVDGTRVEVKNDAPDEAFVLSGFLARKAIKQLKKRGASGDPVMLVSNEPLSADAAASFRKQLGPTAEVLVLSGGRLSTQLARETESNRQPVRRVAVGKPRKTIHRGKTRSAKTLQPTTRRLKRQSPRRMAARLRGRQRAAKPARR